MTPNRILTGKVAIVTGASRGIGESIAKRFATEGAKVVIVARTIDPGERFKGSLTRTAAAIKNMESECLIVQADLSDPTARTSIIDKTIAAFGRIDILVNNAAWQKNKPIWEFLPKPLYSIGILMVIWKL